MIPFNASPGSFDSLKNVVPHPGRVTLIPIRETSGPFPMPNGPPFIAMFNPESFQVGKSFKYNVKKFEVLGISFDWKFHSVEPDEWTFDLLIDGTGASGILNDVTLQIKLFEKMAKFDGNLHEPPKVMAIWGTFIRKCVIVKYVVKYNLFDPLGRPIRANLTVTMREWEAYQKSLTEANVSSPDLTHERLLRSGERLDQHCHQIYNDTRFLPAVAQANDLTSFRNLKPGTTLQFPPIES